MLLKGKLATNSRPWRLSKTMKIADNSIYRLLNVVIFC